MVDVQVIEATQQTLNSNKKRIAAYCRVSSDSSDQINSFIAQVHNYTEYINSQPEMELVDIYADEGISGTTMEKRDDFLRMLKDCRKGKIDRIITKSVSRFARNTMECLKIIRQLKAEGITVLFEKENIDTAKMSDEIFITMLSGVAQCESKSISKNVKIMNRKRMQDGTYISRMAPYGYNYENKTYNIDESKAKIVRRIFSEYLAGYGTSIIANKLNDDRIPPNGNAKKWYSGTIFKMLHNEKYAGDTLWQKTYHENDLPYTTKKNNGELEKYYIYNTHTPLIDRITFELTKELLIQKHPKFDVASANKHHSLYKIIKCGECGGTFKRKVINEKVYWICYHHNIHQRYCSVKSIAEQEVYNAFIIMYNKLKKNSQHILAPAIAQLTELQKVIRQNNTRIGELDKAIAELNEKNHIITKLNNKGFMDDVTYISQKGTIDNDLNKLRSERKKQLQNDDDDDTLDQVITLQTIIGSRDTYMTEFDDQTFGYIIDKIIIDNSKIKFILIGGLEFTERVERSKKQ